jgi:hypothetical protein
VHLCDQFNLSCVLTCVSLYVLLWLNIVDVARFRYWNGAAVVIKLFFIMLLWCPYFLSFLDEYYSNTNIPIL